MLAQSVPGIIHFKKNGARTPFESKLSLASTENLITFIDALNFETKALKGNYIKLL